MACLNPISIPNPNLGKCPTRHLNTKSKYITVPCGKCPACLTQKRMDMVNRFKLEASASDFNYFFTLTYDEINVPTLATLYPDSDEARAFPELQVVDKCGVQLFLQRLRNSFRDCGTPAQLRYAICSEYGPTKVRPHYHGILFGTPPEWNAAIEIQRAWPLGYVSVGHLLDGGCGYVGKYMFKASVAPSMEANPKWSNFFLCSRKPPIGYYGLSHKLIEYINKNGTRRIKIKSGEEIQVPYVLLSKFLSERQVQRLRAIEHIKSSDYNDTRLDKVSFTEGSLANGLRYLDTLKESEWNIKLNNINRSKLQSKDL